MLKTLGILGFSVVETATLVGWLALALSGRRLDAVLLLFGGLAVEHVLSYVVNHLRPGTSGGIPFGKIALFSLTEAAFWIAWLSLVIPHPLAASALLAVALVPQHNIEHNVQTHRKFVFRLLARPGLAVSLVEAVGAYFWLRLANLATVSRVFHYGTDIGTLAVAVPEARILAVAVLFAFLWIEHVFQAGEIEKAMEVAKVISIISL